MSSILIKNVTVVNADGRTLADVFIEDGYIVRLSEPGELELKSDDFVDGSGKFLLPGAIDPHVHFRTPGATHKETWKAGSASAAVGGVTTVFDMPNTNPATITQDRVDEKAAIIQGNSYVNFGIHFGATGNFEAFEEVSGVMGVKVYMGSSTGDLLVDEPTAWEKIFEIAKKKDLPVIVHAEHEQRIRERSREFAESKDPAVHTDIRDCECARIAAEAAIALRERVGNRLHIAHMSTAEELGLVREHNDANLTCEVAPHHLYFSKHDMKDGFLKMNPPLRGEDDLRALWEGLRDGQVNCLATDHAPHTIEEKGLPNPPAGVPGVEFMLPLMLNEVNENMFSLEDIVRLTSVGAAEVFRLKNKARIAEGMDADLVLVDMNLEKTITREMVRSKCAWSPYEGYQLKGWPVLTMVGGVVVAKDGEIVGDCVGQRVT